MMQYSPISSKSTSLGSSMMSTVLLKAKLWCGVDRPCRDSRCASVLLWQTQLASNLCGESSLSYGN